MCARTLAAVPVADLPQRHAAAWACATQHPFLVAVRDGMVPERAFNAWLVQDYRFVCELLRFQARLLGRAPRRAQPVLVSGAAAIVDELTWFEEQARVRGCDLQAAPGAPAYQEFVGHWTVPQFAAYVDALERAADDALGEATDEADAVFAQVVDAESRFWDMAWTGIAP
jgi:thiaminase